MPPDSLQVHGQHEHGKRNPAPTRGATLGNWQPRPGLIQQAGGPLAGRNLLEQGERHK